MATDFEKTVIDVIDAALGRLEGVQAISMLTGILVILCKRLDISEADLMLFVQQRYREFRQDGLTKEDAENFRQ